MHGSPDGFVVQFQPGRFDYAAGSERLDGYLVDTNSGSADHPCYRKYLEAAILCFMADRSRVGADRCGRQSTPEN